MEKFAHLNPALLAAFQDELEQIMKEAGVVMGTTAVAPGILAKGRAAIGKLFSKPAATGMAKGVQATAAAPLSVPKVPSIPKAPALPGAQPQGIAIGGQGVDWGRWGAGPQLTAQSAPGTRVSRVRD